LRLRPAVSFIELLPRFSQARAVNTPEHLADDTCRLDAERKAVEPCSIVIFGASGDLTARKLIPAFYHLHKEKQTPATFRIIGFARREKTDDSWRAELRAALDEFSRTKPVDDAVWREFAANLSYCQGDITDAAAYQKLEQMLNSFGSAPLRKNLLFYLATSPSQFGEVAEQLHQAGLLHRRSTEGWQRLVVEKPFGHDLASAHALNNGKGSPISVSGQEEKKISGSQPFFS
jgi:glucose-6-phosphate 1-dehydrogenase